jgi:sulfonate transport system substrate-binding protein
MTISRRTTLALPWLGAGLLLPLACKRDRAAGGAGRSVADAGARLTLRAADQLYLTQTQLRLAGQLDHLPYDIRWASFPAGPPLLEALNAGAMDVGAAGETPMIFAQAAGWPIRIVAAIRTSPAFQSIIVPHGSPLRTVADLRGKRIALAKGSSAHLFLLRALARDGLRFSDITPVYLTPNDAQPAFENGHLDAWAVWDPFVANNLAQKAIRITDGTGLTAGVGFVATTDQVLRDPARSAALADYLARQRVAQTWASDHKALWAPEYARRTGLSRAVVDDMFTRYDPRFVPLDEGVKQAQQRSADELVDAGLLPKRLVVAGVFDARFDPAQRPAPPTVAL